jgi:hemoglobin
MTRKDITNIGDIQLLVNTFYTKVQKDDLIGAIFNEKIGNR